MGHELKASASGPRKISLCDKTEEIRRLESEFFETKVNFVRDPSMRRDVRQAICVPQFWQSTAILIMTDRKKW
jgi:hypothetical protein